MQTADDTPSQVLPQGWERSLVESSVRGRAARAFRTQLWASSLMAPWLAAASTSLSVPRDVTLPSLFLRLLLRRFPSLHRPGSRPASAPSSPIFPQELRTQAAALTTMPEGGGAVQDPQGSDMLCKGATHDLGNPRMVHGV